MKHTIFFLAALFSILGAAAQPPDAFNYQAVLRDADGNIRANETVGLIININHEENTFFTEAHNVTTNDFGLVNLVIGSVNTSDFQTLNWNEGPFMLEIVVNGTTMGESELLSVPYALQSENATYAEEAANVFSGEYDDLSNKPDLSVYSTTDTTLTEAEVDSMVANNGYLTEDTTLSEAEVRTLVHQYLLDNRDYYQTTVKSTYSTINKSLEFQTITTALWMTVILPVRGRVDLTGTAEVYMNMTSASSKYNVVDAFVTRFDGSLSSYHNRVVTFNHNSDVIVNEHVTTKNSYTNLDAGAYTFYFNFYWELSGDEENSLVSIRNPYFEIRFTPLLPTE